MSDPGAEPDNLITLDDVRAVLDRIKQQDDPGGLELLMPGRFVREVHRLACVPGRHDPLCNTAAALTYTEAHAVGWDTAHRSLCDYEQMGCTLHRNPYEAAQ